MIVDDWGSHKLCVCSVLLLCVCSTMCLVWSITLDKFCRIILCLLLTQWSYPLWQTGTLMIFPILVKTSWKPIGHGDTWFWWILIEPSSGKELNECIKYLSISKKIVNTFLFVKKGSSGKNLDIKGARKSFFCCSGLKETWVMVVCLRHAKAIVHNPQISSLYMIQEKTYPVHSWQTRWCKLQLHVTFLS